MKIKSHQDIINIWYSLDDLAADIKVKYSTIYAWYRRDRIPVEYWKEIIQKAGEGGRKLTPKILLDTLK